MVHFYDFGFNLYNLSSVSQGTSQGTCPGLGSLCYDFRTFCGRAGDGFQPCAVEQPGRKICRDSGQMRPVKKKQVTGTCSLSPTYLDKLLGQQGGSGQG